MKTKLGFVSKMKPTQMCVGFLEVERKKKELEKLSKIELKKYLVSKPIPAVMGPKGEMYLIDHHHMGKALLELGIEKCYFSVLHEFNTIEDKNKFFQVLDLLDLVHPYDENGVKVDYKFLPKSLTDLKDDPYRSLSGLTRKAGGYNKIKKPYLEFEWADFFRDKITKKEIQENLNEAIEKAISIAKSHLAIDMLGFNGDLEQKSPKIKMKA